MAEGRALDFKHKDVININDGKKLGFVTDVEACFENGRINAIVVPGTKKMNIFSNSDIVIPWEKIKLIGEDVILVEI